MQDLRRERKNITLVYSKRAQIMMNSIKDFDIDKFEKDFADELLIGDITISRYILEKGLKELKEKEKTDGTKRK